MDNMGYYRRRASEERAAALRARSLPSFRAHMDMVREYERRIYSCATTGS